MLVCLIILFVGLIVLTYEYIMKIREEKGYKNSTPYRVIWFLVSILTSAIIIVLIVVFMAIAGIAINSFPAVTEYVNTLF